LYSDEKQAHFTASKARRRYDAEFKVTAVQMIEYQHRESKVSQGLGVRESLLNKL